MRCGDVGDHVWEGGPTEGACSMAVPAMSTRPRTSALRMTHHANHKQHTLGSCP